MTTAFTSRPTALSSRRLIKPLLTALATAALAACGGGDDNTTLSAAPAAPISTTISGSAVKGPVSGATVTVKRPDGTACVTTPAAVTTTPTGSYSLTTVCTGDVLVEVTGGNYLDEASNTTTPLSTPLRVMVATNGGTVTGVATPLTTMAYSYAFRTPAAASTATAAAFNAQASRIATQFGLGSVNLATALPVVSGTPDAYGNALRAVSQYLRNNPQTTLATITNASFTTQADFTAFSTAYNTAFRTINGTAANVSFDGSAFNFTGTGVGGGSGTCGIKIAGSVTTAGFTVPVSFDFCYTGIQAGSCDAGNSALNQSVAGQGGLGGVANLTYTYSATCAPGATTVNLQ